MRLIIPIFFLLTSPTLCLATNLPVTTLPPLAVSAPAPKPSTGESTLISANDIARKQSFFAQDILRESPGLHLSNAGDNGRLTRFSMRGAASGENLVLIDGIPVNDPASSGGFFDFADLMTHDIETIHVQPGAGTIIYGSDAMGGVIDINTKRGSGPLAAQITTEAGSHDSFMNKASASGETGPLSLSGTLAGFRTGTGSFTNKIHHNRQGDFYRNQFGAFKTGYMITPNAEIETGLRYSKAHLQFDDIKFTPEGTLPILADNYQDTRHHTAYVGFQGEFADGFIVPEIKLSQHVTARAFTLPETHFHTKGEQNRLHAKTALNWSPQHKSDMGFEVAHDHITGTFTGSHNRPHQGVFIQHHYAPWESTEFTAGTRFDHYADHCHQQTYRFEARQQIGTSQFRSSYGTGFKAPLLNDMFNTSKFVIANPHLTPETNHNFDIGVDHKLAHEKIELNLTFFRNSISHVFATLRTPDFKYQRINHDKRIARGLEGKAAFKLSNEFKVLFNATYTKAIDNNGKTRKNTPFLPRLKTHEEIIFSPTEPWEFSFSSTHNTSQIDNISRKILPGFRLMHLRGSYEYKGMTFFGRIENLANKRYEPTFGYGVRGRGFFMGMKLDVAI